MCIELQNIQRNCPNRAVKVQRVKRLGKVGENSRSLEISKITWLGGSFHKKWVWRISLFLFIFQEKRRINALLFGLLATPWFNIHDMSDRCVISPSLKFYSTVLHSSTRQLNLQRLPAQGFTLFWTVTKDNTSKCSKFPWVRFIFSCENNTFVAFGRCHCLCSRHCTLSFMFCICSFSLPQTLTFLFPDRDMIWLLPSAST